MVLIDDKGNALQVNPALLPLGFVYKRYSWRDKCYCYHVIKGKEIMPNNEAMYLEVLVVDDLYKCFTSNWASKIEAEFKNGTYLLLDEKEFEEFRKAHSFTINRLRESKNIDDFVRDCSSVDFCKDKPTKSI